jgi:hypothetical protein
VRHPLFFTSPQPFGSTLPSRLRSTSLWSVFRPSLKVCWLHLIPVRSVVLQAATTPCLHFKPLNLLSRDLMFAFVRAEEGFLFLSPCTLCDFIDATSSLRFDMTLSPTLHLHVNRGLVRHGYPWVPTDQGPRGPCQVDLTCQKHCRPASGPRDLTHNSSDPGRPWTTLSRSRKTCRACGASFSIDHGGGAASRPEDREILSVITGGDLPKSVTDPYEGPPTLNGNPSPPAI